MTPLDLIDANAVDTGGDVSRPGRKRDHTRDADILDAALEVLAESGYEGMTIDMVAARAHAGKATVYRRWASKAELVLDAVACMKRSELQDHELPDTGTLRGDLIALIKPVSIEEGEKKLQVMSGIVSMLSRSPELADAAQAALVAPRQEVNRALIHRAVERGEVSADRDIETLASVSSAMICYRALMMRKPITREYLISVIDEVVLPALGVTPSAE
ncbi:TetR/AcrR family transcriptional regulator [Microbacterium sp. SORGH_AS_0888]|uniref:TetR/AcrR family transcriptional regulator n=1 Tax=Microbacterium sp. SORGH_AS_0888 TaxID=3041791 RepID=UPI00277F67B7|nr:TetR/AcrR family transcriptional regulator [Microbacterium sp. SORGH_AS_0888]MDQ1131163.1 AcrR family transcriptional regulator [Microbacterium sp. SORGH_AS_0888]